MNDHFKISFKIHNSEKGKVQLTKFLLNAVYCLQWETWLDHSVAQRRKILSLTVCFIACRSISTYISDSIGKFLHKMGNLNYLYVI